MQSENKKFTAVIYLFEEKAVKSLSDHSVISAQPDELAKMYSDNNADEIIVFDQSKSDEEHDKAIGMLKQIIEAVEVPVIGCGNIKRFEDVKKLLYAGCQKVALNYSKVSNIDITEEVSKRFGKDKIAAFIDCADQIINHRDLINEYVSELFVINGAESRNCIAQSEVKLQVLMQDGTLDRITELLLNQEVSGVYGDQVNANIVELNSMKALLSENGVATNGFDAKMNFAELTKNSDGLVPVVVQDYKTKEVLMVAYMNELAFDATIKTGRMNYYSRSRKTQWLKGETSGHFQYVKSLTADCDSDTLLAKVSQVGPACHTGSRSCFFKEIVKRDCMETDPLKVFDDVFAVIMDRKIHPKEGSYTNYLFDKGIDKILKKLGEESTEIVIAAKNPDKEEIKYEIADYLYHMMVLMAEKDVSWSEITRELARR